MTTHPLGRLCGSVFAALLAATAVAGCSETQPPTTPSGIGGDDGTQPTSPLCNAAATNGGSPSPTARVSGPAGFSFSPFPPNYGATLAAAVAPPAISGGTLRILAGGQTAVAADPDRDSVYIVDLTTKSVRATISLNPGDEPGRVVADAAGRAHVALRHGGALVSIDTVAGTLLQRRDVCAAPRGLAYDAATDLVHVACSGGELVSLPAAGGQRGSDRDAGGRPSRRRRRRPAPARQPVPVRRAADRRSGRDGIGCREAGFVPGRRARAAASGSRRAWPGRWPRCPTAAA